MRDILYDKTPGQNRSDLDMNIDLGFVSQTVEIRYQNQMLVFSFRADSMTVPPSIDLQFSPDNETFYSLSPSLITFTDNNPIYTGYVSIPNVIDRFARVICTSPGILVGQEVKFCYLISFN